MSSDMLKEMQAAGMSIENHTANHLELDKLSRADAYDSIKRGQDFLRNNIGSDANYLCYPVGKYSDETIEIQKEFGRFSNYIWKFTNNKIIKNTSNEQFVSTPLSDEISKDLKMRGMKYVGTVIIYSYLQAIGVVNDHESDCFKRQTVLQF